MPTWSPGKYLKFSEERTRPCHDLAARISVSPVRRVIDLGCGPGNSTEVLAGLWPDAELTGLDSSTHMIDDARRSHPGWRWIAADIVDWAFSDREPFDVVFANAALQWVPNHDIVYPRLLERVAPGGALAIQVPGHMNDAAHRIMREMAESPSWMRHFPPGRVREWHVHDLDFYYDVLAPHAARLDMWETHYLHVLPDVESVVEWYRGTALRSFLDVLTTAEDRDRFIADYLERLRPAFTPRPDGSILFPFRRLFAIAYR
jgi:trans-aconitate 2-methyltransferase